MKRILILLIAGLLLIGCGGSKGNVKTATCTLIDKDFVEGKMEVTMKTKDDKLVEVGMKMSYTKDAEQDFTMEELESVTDSVVVEVMGSGDEIKKTIEDQTISYAATYTQKQASELDESSFMYILATDFYGIDQEVASSEKAGFTCTVK